MNVAFSIRSGLTLVNLNPAAAATLACPRLILQVTNILLKRRIFIYIRKMLDILVELPQNNLCCILLISTEEYSFYYY